ncbi:MAG: Hsp20/alpha crystallin family protein [Candidatus Latescibacterota bacterium]|nr:MAG: Hsp20/alpha crystallin family protein [Candidatus Latescibacterota bacterium]
MDKLEGLVERKGLVDREFHNIRELLELLMTEQATTKKQIRMRPSLGWAPPTDVYHTETEFVVTMDIAGMDLKDISVFTDGKIVTIRGVREEITPRCKKQFHTMEIRVGPFQRHIEIPVAVDNQSVHTNYSNGFLEVRLKRKFETPDKRKIDVE